MKVLKKVPTPFFSVIVNCHNGEQFLANALDSIINQSFTNWEVVFWDNCSTDNSASIFSEYQDSRFNYYVSSKKTPLGEARNLAISKAKGVWITFLDCDDIWLSFKLERQYEIIKKSSPNVALVYGDIEIFRDLSTSPSHSWGELLLRKKDRPLLNLPEGNIFPLLAKENFIGIVAAAIKRDAIDLVGGINETLKQAEDYDLLLKVAYRFDAAACLAVIAKYRVHKNNLSAKQYDLNYTESIDILKTFLPDRVALQGIKSHYNAMAINFIRNGKVLRGIMTFIQHGSFYLLFNKLKK